MLAQGELGFCRARKNVDGSIQSTTYGKLSSLSLDPIEKKPLCRFYPGSMILSAGSFGCNMRCKFCQNYHISMTEDAGYAHQVSPEKIVQIAKEQRKYGNIGLAFTYNEPLINWEFVLDTSILLHKEEMKSVVVTNGSVSEEIARKILPNIDALNIDLKSFEPKFYQQMNGDLDTVKRFIKLAVAYECHVEITTLVIPGMNDSEKEIEAISKWLQSLSKDIAYHLSPFYPMYLMQDIPVTDTLHLRKLSQIARKNIKYVYTR